MNTECDYAEIRDVRVQELDTEKRILGYLLYNQDGLSVIGKALLSLHFQKREHSFLYSIVESLDVSEDNIPLIEVIQIADEQGDKEVKKAISEILAYAQNCPLRNQEELVEAAFKVRVAYEVTQKCDECYEFHYNPDPEEWPGDVFDEYDPVDEQV